MEKLNTLRQKLNKKLEDLETVKGELTEDLAKVIQSHSEAVDQHQKIIANPNNAWTKVSFQKIIFPFS